VLNLVTLGAQHQGVFGFPRCPANGSELCESVRELLDYGAYIETIQDHITQSNYWHDSLDENLYLSKCKFLPDINNAKSTKNSAYKQRLLTLRNFVMVMFLNDQMVQPRESSLFQFYYPGQDKLVQPLIQSPLYVNDWLGLRTLDTSGRLHLLTTPGDHLHFTDSWFVNTIVPFLAAKA
jgi:palmitoyl-protein thioesterase